MSYFIRKAAALYDSSWKDTCIESGTLVAQSVANQIAKKSFYQILNSYVGKKTSTVLRISYPYLAKVNEYATPLLKGDMNAMIADFQKSQKKLMKSVVVMIHSSPAKLIELHTEHYVKKGTLDTICQLLEEITQSSFGKMVYVAAIPIVAPSVSPLTSLSYWEAMKLGTAALAPPPATDEDQGVELDDFRDTFEIVEAPEMADWVILDDQP